MGLRMKNIDILGVYWKILMSRGGSSWKTDIEGGLTVFRFKGGGLGKKEGVVFLRWVDTLMHTMDNNQRKAAHGQPLLVGCDLSSSQIVPLIQSDCSTLWSSISLERIKWYLSFLHGVCYQGNLFWLGMASCVFSLIRLQDSLIINFSGRYPLIY